MDTPTTDKDPLREDGTNLDIKNMSADECHQLSQISMLRNRKLRGKWHGKLNVIRAYEGRVTKQFSHREAEVILKSARASFMDMKRAHNINIGKYKIIGARIRNQLKFHTRTMYGPPKPLSLYPKSTEYIPSTPNAISELAHGDEAVNIHIENMNEAAIQELYDIISKRSNRSRAISRGKRLTYTRYCKKIENRYPHEVAKHKLKYVTLTETDRLSNVRLVQGKYTDVFRRLRAQSTFLYNRSIGPLPENDDDDI